MLRHNDDKDPLLFINPRWDRGPWIAGGAPLAWYNDEAVTTDIDVYFKDEKAFNKLYNTFKEEEVEVKSSGPGHLFNFFETKKKNKDVRIIHKSDNAITVRYKEKWTVQLIRHTYYKDPQAIIDNFDISVCQLVTDGYNNLVFGPDTLRDIRSNTLRIENYRAGCVSRLVKYMAYGYKPVDGTLENIINIPKLDEDFKEGFEEYDY